MAGFPKAAEFYLRAARLLIHINQISSNKAARACEYQAWNNFSHLEVQGFNVFFLGWQRYSLIFKILNVFSEVVSKFGWGLRYWENIGAKVCLRKFWSKLYLSLFKKAWNCGLFLKLKIIPMTVSDVLVLNRFYSDFIL